MTIIVTDVGFSDEPTVAAYVPLAQLSFHEGAIDLENTDDPTRILAYLVDLRLIRIAFPSFTDGRGLTLGRRIRMSGFKGRLRARGHVLADQYAMMRRVGFDEVEISDELAARQPEAQWMFRADWRAHDYQMRLRA